MEYIPRSHPRYHSLKTRQKISSAMEKGIVHDTGLIAHGRGEAFDYLLGESTIRFADYAAKTAAAMLLVAKQPVISVNGNVVALTAEECIRLSLLVSAKLEVNLFHRSNKRVCKIIQELKKYGAQQVYGEEPDARIPGLDHDRGLCATEGIFSADVVLVPLEDGDRCQALKYMGKQVITIDLNPLSRTAKASDITIVDNIIRAIPNIESWVYKLKNKNNAALEAIIRSWDNEKMLKNVLSVISKKLNSLF